MRNFELGVILLLAVFWFVAVGHWAFAAESKTMDQLIAERSSVKSAMTALEKQYNANQIEFEKTEAAQKYNVTQGQIKKSWTDAQTKLRDLDAAIADKVVGEKGKK